MAASHPKNTRETQYATLLTVPDRDGYVNSIGLATILGPREKCVRSIDRAAAGRLT